MGRITVFTAGNDLNSIRVLKALETRGLPYTEINILAHPSKAKDLQELINSPSIPQVFFNARHVGGSQSTLRDLRRSWDRSNQYSSALEKYQAEIQSSPDPNDKRLAIPTAKALKRQAPREYKTRKPIMMPNGSRSSVAEVMELLKSTLPRTVLRYKGVFYNNCFAGDAAVNRLSKRLKATDEQTTSFLRHLLNVMIIHHVADGAPGGGGQANNHRHPGKRTDEFKDSSEEVYILQCYKTPRMVNSYRIWTLPINPKNTLNIVDNLVAIMASLEETSVTEYGLLDYQRAVAQHNRYYTLFEDAVCELQRVDLGALTIGELKTFALNTYSIMLRYAFIKMGIPGSASSRSHFVRKVQFNIGGDIFSLQEWTDGILRGNKRARNSANFGRSDPRRRFEDVLALDGRIHFALNLGAHVGCSRSVPFPKFSVKRLEQELDVAARVFCEDDANVLIDIKRGEVRLSSVFEQYRCDFAANETGLLEVIFSCLGGKKRDDLAKIFFARTRPRVIFQNPSWGKYSINSSSYDKNGEQQQPSKGGLRGRLRFRRRHSLDHHQQASSGASGSSNRSSQSPTRKTNRRPPISRSSSANWRRTSSSSPVRSPRHRIKQLVPLLGRGDGTADTPGRGTTTCCSPRSTNAPTTAATESACVQVTMAPESGGKAAGNIVIASPVHPGPRHRRPSLSNDSPRSQSSTRAPPQSSGITTTRLPSLRIKELEPLPGDRNDDDGEHGASNGTINTHATHPSMGVSDTADDMIGAGTAHVKMKRRRSFAGSISRSPMGRHSSATSSPCRSPSQRIKQLMFLRCCESDGVNNGGLPAYCSPRSISTPTTQRSMGTDEAYTPIPRVNDGGDTSASTGLRRPFLVDL